jgi:hypothetical protein
MATIRAVTNRLLDDLAMILNNSHTCPLRWFGFADGESRLLNDHGP